MCILTKLYYVCVSGFHGRLSSSNCVVDSRWICKITDYGLHHIKQAASGGKKSDDIPPSSFLWTAPELLRLDPQESFGTKKGDIYSFGIICQEIVLQSEPYSSNDLEPEDILQKIRQGLHPPYRPEIPNGK